MGSKDGNSDFTVAYCTGKLYQILLTSNHDISVKLLLLPCNLFKLSNKN